MAEKQSAGTVLVTGGTDGFGRAIAVLLAGQGYRVFAAGRSAERRAELEQYAKQGGLPIDTLEMDVCDDASVDRALAEARSLGGPIDILVNNAGIGFYAVMEEIRMEDLRKQFETNFFGVVRVTQRVLPEMRQRRRGRIINMSSIAGKIAVPLFGPYSGSKFALEAISDAMRLELFPFSIYVSLIEPGYIPTGFQKVAAELASPYAARAAHSPYRQIYEKFGKSFEKRRRESKYTAEDCARVVLRAVRETPPRPRYTVTRMARWISLVRRLVPDRVLDRRLLRSYRLEREPGASRD